MERIDVERIDVEPTGDDARRKNVTVARPLAPAPDGTSVEAGPFAEVYATQYVPLVRLAYVTIGSLAAAEDVVQEVFAEFYRNVGTVRAPVPYLRRAVVSRCTSLHRRRLVERRHEHVASAWTADVGIPLGPDATAVRAAMLQLSPLSAGTAPPRCHE